MTTPNRNPQIPKTRTEYVGSGAEDILTVAYRLDQVAQYRDREKLQHFVPTSGWLREQARILREAIDKEGLDV